MSDTQPLAIQIPSNTAYTLKPLTVLTLTARNSIYSQRTTQVIQFGSQ